MKGALRPCLKAPQLQFNIPPYAFSQQKEGGCLFPMGSNCICTRGYFGCWYEWAKAKKGKGCQGIGGQQRRVDLQTQQVIQVCLPHFPVSLCCKGAFN